MNDTVARIVDLMFQELEMNDDVAAIHDEVMNNCQDRFNDLVAAGMSEDDAIAAVVESLKGMEDVLAPYKRKVQHTSEDIEDELEGEHDAVFEASKVQKVNVLLVNEDVRIEASDDECFHVIWDENENPLVHAYLENNVLKVERQPGDAVKMKNDGRMEYQHKDDMADFFRTEKGKIEINMNTIDQAMKSLGSSMKKMFTGNNLRISIGFAGDSKVTIQIPENAIPHVKLLTTSGDIEVEDVVLADLNVTSTSGDITIDLDEKEALKLVELRTTSGDIDATAHAQGMTVSSTSGDAEIEGQINHLAINTISGDIDVRADVKNVTFKAISGDVELEFTSEEIQDVRGSTISGDIDIDLPNGIGFMNIQTNTRSGDVTTRCHTNGYGPVVNGSVTSMSGDITIR